MRLLSVWLSLLGGSPAAAHAPDAAAPLACPATVAALPAGSYEASDARLQGERVIVVDKAGRRAMVYERGALIEGSCWRVALGALADGSYPAGPKRQRGDRKTPEGWYATSDRPWSAFYGAITIHYPNAADLDAGLAAGLIDAAQHRAMRAAHLRGELPDQDTRLGGALLLHGGGSGADWTLGCVAFDDADLDALRGLLPAGMKAEVLILP